MLCCGITTVCIAVFLVGFYTHVIFQKVRAVEEGYKLFKIFFSFISVQVKTDPTPFIPLEPLESELNP